MELSPSFFNIITFVLLILIILVALKTVNFFAKRILKRQQFRSFWNRYFGAFELFVWLVFGLLSIEYFTVNNKIIAIIIAVVFVLLVFVLIYFYFKEILVRVFFKLTTDIKVGDEVKNENYAGKIIHIEYNQLVIERADGSQTGIPYSKIIFNPLIKQSPSPYLHRFESVFTAPTRSDRNRIQQQILSLLLTDIRVSGAVEPKISFSDLNELTYQIKVIAFLFNSADTEPLRESLKMVLPE
jgi:hypothetical protein